MPIARRTTLPLVSDRIPIGPSSLGASPFAIGCVKSPDAVLRAFDLGINFFFLTADMHWPVYEPLRQGLAALFARGTAVRDQVIIGVVSYLTQREFCWAPFQEAISSVRGLDHVDVQIAGGGYGQEILQRIQLYRYQSEAGYSVGARAYGATFHDRAAAVDAIRSQALDVAFIRYSSRHQGGATDVLPFLPTRPRPALFCFNAMAGSLPSDLVSRLGEGTHIPRPVDQYRFVLGLDGFDGVLCAPATAREVEELASAMQEPAMSLDEEKVLLDVTHRATELARFERLAGERLLAPLPPNR